MTNKEINTAVKSELKAAGYNVKDFRVSVKDSLYNVVLQKGTRCEDWEKTCPGY